MYPLRPEFRRYSGLHLPLRPGLLRIANALMPVIQSGRRLDKRLTSGPVDFGEFKAMLLRPCEGDGGRLLVYLHGGAFLVKAGAYQKDLAQEYALRGGCSVLFVDYRLAPRHRFPTPVQDCCRAYQWAREQGCSTVMVGGDSAGGNLALAVARSAMDEGKPLPDALMLIYPVVDSRMQTDSMRRFTDTPLWNSRLNAGAVELYADECDRHHPLFSALEAGSFSGFPPTYIETAEFDCLRDEGLELAVRLREDGVPVTLNETKGTMHGYDIAARSPYVQEQVQKRIGFLRGV